MTRVIKWADYVKSANQPLLETTLTPDEQRLILDRLVKLQLFNRAFHWAKQMTESER